MEVKKWDGTKEEEVEFSSFDEAKLAMEEALMREEVESVKIRKIIPPTTKQNSERKKKQKAQKKARKRNRS